MVAVRVLDGRDTRTERLRREGSRTTIVACTTFAAGALVGAIVTFGGLACSASALGAAAPAAAAVIAFVAALGELRGTRIVPQVRRQVPESWRRVHARAARGRPYGVLLGLGFTTFILTFAVWALAGVAVALGDPQLRPRHRSRLRSRAARCR